MHSLTHTRTHTSACHTVGLNASPNWTLLKDVFHRRPDNLFHSALLTLISSRTHTRQCVHTHTWLYQFQLFWMYTICAGGWWGLNSWLVALINCSPRNFRLNFAQNCNYDGIIWFHTAQTAYRSPAHWWFHCFLARSSRFIRVMCVVSKRQTCAHAHADAQKHVFIVVWTISFWPSSILGYIPLTEFPHVRSLVFVLPPTFVLLSLSHIFHTLRIPSINTSKFLTCQWTAFRPLF